MRAAGTKATSEQLLLYDPSHSTLGTKCNNNNENGYQFMYKELKAR